MSGATITITVAVAACGRPEALERCLEAVAAQTLVPDALLVVDQAPNEHARAAVERCGVPGATYLEQQRLGLSASRNLALEHSSTSALALTDDDCAPDRGWLEAVAAAIERDPAPGAVTGPIRTPLGPAPPDGYAISLRESDRALDQVGLTEPWRLGSGGNFTASVADLRELGGWDERLGAGSSGMAAEDAELIYRILKSGGRVRYEPAAVVRHAWQSRERRMSTRWSYGFGVGAMCGIWLARGDAYSVWLFLRYFRLQLRGLVVAVLRGDDEGRPERVRALLGASAGLLRGLRDARRPAGERGVESG